MTTSRSDALEKLKVYELHNPGAALTPLERAAVRLTSGPGDKTRAYYSGYFSRYASSSAVQAFAAIAACDAAEVAGDSPGYSALRLGIAPLIDWNAIDAEMENEATAQPVDFRSATLPPSSRSLAIQQEWDRAGGVSIKNFTRNPALAIPVAAEEVPPDWRPKHPDTLLTPPEVEAVKKCWLEDADDGTPRSECVAEARLVLKDPDNPPDFVADARAVLRACKAADDAETAALAQGTVAAPGDSVAVFIAGRQGGKSELMRQRYAESISSTPNDPEPPRYRDTLTADELAIYHEVINHSVRYYTTYIVLDPAGESHPAFNKEREVIQYVRDTQERRARAAVEKYRAAKAKERAAQKPHGQTPAAPINTWGGNDDE